MFSMALSELFTLSCLLLGKLMVAPSLRDSGGEETVETNGEIDAPAPFGSNPAKVLGIA